MSSFSSLLVIFCLILTLASVMSSRPGNAHRRNKFQDYLSHFGRKRPVRRHHSRSMALNRMTSDDEDLGDQFVGSGSGPSPRETILDYLKEVPRSQWSCCVVGRLAGDKELNCQPQFHRASISWKTMVAQKSKNRSHLKHNHRMERSKALLYMFRKCLAGRAHEFKKCCYSASVERRERHRWYFYHENRVSNRGI